MTINLFFKLLTIAQWYYLQNTPVGYISVLETNKNLAITPLLCSTSPQRTLPNAVLITWSMGSPSSALEHFKILLLPPKHTRTLFSGAICKCNSHNIHSRRGYNVKSPIMSNCPYLSTARRVKYPTNPCIARTGGGVPDVIDKCINS